MATENIPIETAPEIEQPAPATALPKLDSITQEDLSKEIGAQPREKADFKEENFRVGDDKGHVIEKDLEGFGKAARELQAKKIKEAEEARKAPKETEEEPKKTAKKEVVSADDAAPPVKKDEAVPPERLPDDQLKVLPHDKPLTARRIQQLLKDKEELQKERDEARAAAKANPTATNVEEFNRLKEEHSKASDELLRFRRRYEIDNDETFKKTYDEPVTHAETAIENTLKKYQLGDATLKAIKDEGGFAAFSRSSRTFPIVEIDPETQEKKTIQRAAGELARNWLNAIPVADAEFIKSALGKQAMLSEEKKVAVERAVGESKKFYEQREAQERQQRESAQKDAETKSKEYASWLDKTTKETEWLKDKPVPDNATEEQRKKIEEDNKSRAQFRAELAAHPKNTEEYSSIMFRATQSKHLQRELAGRDEQIKSLQAELTRLKGASRTTPKGGSLISDSGKPAKNKDDGVAPEDFRTGFRKAAQARLGGDDE